MFAKPLTQPGLVVFSTDYVQKLGHDVVGH